MTVWVINGNDRWEDWCTKVFSTEEKAKAELNEIAKAHEEYEEFEDYDYEVVWYERGVFCHAVMYSVEMDEE